MKNSDLYVSNNVYDVVSYNSKDEWLNARTKGIGGSDASCIVGMNPWKTSEQLYLEKIGKLELEDISNKKAVVIGTNAEKQMRELFSILNEEKFDVEYIENTILYNKKKPYLYFSPDGLLVEKETGLRGIYECKTTTLLNSMSKEKWNEKVPDNYFIQLLHGLMVTNLDFAIINALLIFSDGYQQIRNYRFNRADYIEDIAYLEEKETSFWLDNIENGVKPPLIISF